jgi:hypothetical protein
VKHGFRGTGSAEKKLLSYRWLSPQYWYCILWNPQWRLLVFEKNGKC